jgi:hypothetical protein
LDALEHEAQVRKFVAEVWNGRNYNAAADLCSDGYASPFGRGPIAKAEGNCRNHQAFAEMRLEINDLIIADDTVVLRFTLRGTDTSGYAGRLPTGRAVEEWAVNIMRFEADRVASEWMGTEPRAPCPSFPGMPTMR